jgi:IS5 family transposase
MGKMCKNLAILRGEKEMVGEQNNKQRTILGLELEVVLDHSHALYKLANKVDWKYFEEKFGTHYCEDNGRPSKPIRLMVGLHYLKSIYGESDESVVEKWVENPYWQYFCGEKEFQHEFPTEPTNLVKWRKRIKSKGMEELFKESIRLGLETKLLKKQDLEKVNVDTTVQEKAIAYPTDAKLYHKMREKLVDEAEKEGVKLRQNYRRKSKQSLFKQAMYRKGMQTKRAKKEVKKLKTFLGRVKRDIERKTEGLKISKKLEELLIKAERLLNQNRGDKNKLYSIHAPEVECIAKGKAHKKYEFGCKVSIVSSSKKNFILGVKAYHGNPFDGHTLEKSLSQAQKMVGRKSIKEAYVDKGYRGQGKEVNGTKIFIAKRGYKRLKPSMRKWFKRRSAIEPLIGHIKNDNGGNGKNYLLGKEGDQLNAIFTASGFNMRKLLRAFFLLILEILFFNKFFKKSFAFAV